MDHDREHHRPSALASATFVLTAVAAVPALVFGSFLATMGAWIGQERYWYAGPILLLVGLGCSIGAGLYAFSLGSIWGALLVASPAVCVGLGYVIGSGGPTIGVLFSPPAILLGLVIALSTEERRRAEEEEEDRTPSDIPRVWYPEPAAVRPAGPESTSLQGTPLTIETVPSGDDDPASPHVMP